ncbi:Ppx/GppA family phosphatase [Peptacetobacter hominis]|uniref:Ppx/GppA family phosphatase n=1 Tax=Peptacetobacter hominis TaxID=2743610 RepID=A0A544QTH7_9FIRM|nr:Ppx/GppA phosphatase family protein [Peptacetobacter hominis]TQQ83997.1 Ppx/GppA family phosphatase [Peptacetobacter hominis]
MKLGAIDIGTNSMRLLVADVQDKKLVSREKYINTTRIGQGVDENGYITDEAMERNITALYEFSQMCKEKGCEKVRCMGTSALRDAVNRDVFIEKAREKSGIKVEVIAGEKEAELGFRGVLMGASAEGNLLILDIGGGSTEFIFGNNNGIIKSVSIDIGALRLTEKFRGFEKDAELYSEMINFIKEKTNDIIEYLRECEISTVCGIGGTITSMSAINQKLEVYSMEKVHQSVITAEDADSISEMLRHSTEEDRKSMKGLQPKRADIITAGAVILDTIIKSLDIDRVVVSEYDNLEGLVSEMIYVD